MTPTFEFRHWNPSFITAAAAVVANSYERYENACGYMDADDALFEMFSHQVLPCGTLITHDNRELLVRGYTFSGMVLLLSAVGTLREKDFSYQETFGWYCTKGGDVELAHFADVLESQRGRWS